MSKYLFSTRKGNGLNLVNPLVQRFLFFFGSKTEVEQEKLLNFYLENPYFSKDSFGLPNLKSLPVSLEIKNLEELIIKFLISKGEENAPRMFKELILFLEKGHEAYRTKISQLQFALKNKIPTAPDTTKEKLLQGRIAVLEKQIVELRKQIVNLTKQNVELTKKTSPAPLTKEFLASADTLENNLAMARLRCENDRLQKKNLQYEKLVEDLFKRLGKDI